MTLLSLRIYGFLLRCCPGERLLDRDEMIDVFRSALNEEWEAHGWTGGASFIWGAILDTVIFALREWTALGIERLETRRTPPWVYPDFQLSQKERCLMILDTLWSHVRFGTRSLARTPLVTTVAVWTIALAVGLTALTFSLIYGTLMRPLPFAQGEHIMSLDLVTEEGHRPVQFEAADWRDFRRMQTSFTSLEGYLQRQVTLETPSGGAQSLRAGVVTASALDHLGVRPLLGRTFAAGEDFTSDIRHVVLGHDVWERSFGRRPDIVGRPVRVDGRMLEVIGVMPAEFHFPARQNLWLPMDFDAPEGERGAGRSFQVFGRLTPGLDMEQARAEAALIAGRISSQHADAHPPLTAEVRPFIKSQLPKGLDGLLTLLLAAVAGILLIAAANIVNLLLARAVMSASDNTIRSALGAGRGDLTVRFLIESLVLSMVGTIVGTGLAAVGMIWMQRVASRFSLPYWNRLALDLPVLGGTTATAVALALLIGSLAAWQGTRGGTGRLSGNSRNMSRRRVGRLGSGLVIAQIAVSCALLIGAGLLGKSLLEARSLEFGFDAEPVLTAEARLNRIDFPEGPSRARFYLSTLERAADVPGVEAAAWVRSPPGTGSTFSWPFQVEGQASRETQAGSQPTFADGVPVSRGYFDVLDIALLRGRDFTADESRFGGPVAVIVNDTLARRHLGPEPIGKRLRLSDDSREPWLEVVGVVEDTYIGSSAGGIGLDAARREQIFVSWGIAPYSRATLLVRASAGDPLGVIPQTQAMITSIAPAVSLTGTTRLDHLIDETTWAFGLFGSLFGVFGGVALILSMIGLYGVSAFVVSRRRQEMGVRVALGATPASLLHLVLTAATRQLVLGTTLGLALGYGLARSIRALLFGVGWADPQVYALIVLILMLTGLGAAVLSARPVGRIDPAEVLSG